LRICSVGTQSTQISRLSTHISHTSLNITIKFFQPKSAFQTLPAFCNSLPGKHKIQPKCLTPFLCRTPSTFRFPVLYLRHVSTLYLACILFLSEGRAGSMGTFILVIFLFFPVRVNFVSLIRPKDSVFFSLSVCDCHLMYYTAGSTALFEIYTIQCTGDNYVEF